MTCTCKHADEYLVFPILAAQPAGPRENWPDYFVPSVEHTGGGLYYCPKCRDGLEEARASAGLVKQLEVPIKAVPLLLRSLRMTWQSIKDELWIHPPQQHL